MALLIPLCMTVSMFDPIRVKPNSCAHAFTKSAKGRLIESANSCRTALAISSGGKSVASRAVTGIETALYFIFPEEDETIVCGTVEVKAVEYLFQMRFYPLSQPADSPFDQNLFAE